MLESIPTSSFALIVDDDPDSQMLVTAMLEYAGYGVEQALTFEAAEAALARQPLCVILDLVMPGDASRSLCEAMLARHDDTPIILMSGLEKEHLSERQEHWRSRGLNMVAVLAKPFWLDKLLEALNVALPVHRADLALSPDPLESH
ncbi:hypothetical protein C7S18_16470 [Ahniella affigens]|uniref:Response regulatory domain-containing protein n=1 Tax=Ahniella affigens TaxID=2021234 RepID=A0A2P1PV08_9GAMM|nr:response regulator [Ahniella affigens]AVP98683.1 hypothetical protein C7S18_16470 [Ahniella affigens]